MSTVVMVLGAPRSGTSALAGSIAQAGVYFGKTSLPSPDNQKGNMENPEIWRAHDMLFAANRCTWQKPQVDIKTTRRFDEFVQRFRDRMRPHAPWGFKDPRTLFTLEIWQSYLREFDVYLIGVVRHPMGTALSLQARDGMSIKEGLKVWHKYNTRLGLLYNKLEFPIVPFDERFLDAVWATCFHYGLSCNVEGFYSPALHHHHPSDEGVSEEMLRLYRYLAGIT